MILRATKALVLCSTLGVAASALAGCFVRELPPIDRDAPDAATDAAAVAPDAGVARRLG